jgi:hypothetical protein
MTKTMTEKIKNLINTKLGALIVLVILGFVACEKSSELGDNVLPASDTLSLYIDTTVDVQISTLTDDLITSGSASYVYLGSTYDPAFGYTTGGFASVMRLSDTIGGTNATIDSVVLFMQSTETDAWDGYGKFGVRQGFKVYELGKFIQTTDTLRSSDDLSSYKGDLLATGYKTFYKTGDSIIRIPLGGAGSAITQKFQNNLSSFKDTTKIEDFWKVFKGLYIEPTKEDGVMVNVNFYDNTSEQFVKTDTIKDDKGEIIKNSKGEDSTRNTITYRHGNKVMVYYKYTSSTNTVVKDSASLVFYSYYDSSTGVTTTDGHTSAYKHYFPAEVTSVVGKENQKFSYTVPLGGLKTRVKFELPDVLKSGERYIINKADLELPVEANSTQIPPDYMWVTASTRNDKDSLIYEYSSLSSKYGAFYDLKKGRYLFNVADRVQRMVNKEYTNNGFFVWPQTKWTSPRRAIFLNDARKVKLRLIYTKVNKLN